MSAHQNNIIGMMGGTFNPIHHGHLRMAQELADALHLDEVRFVPSANPPHKTTPQVSAEHRAAMVQLAISDNALFQLDQRELARTGASYTFDTLQSLRDELGNEVSLCLLMGSDAFVHFNTWHRWQEILSLCHIVLVTRPSTKPQPALAAELQTLLHNHYTEDRNDLLLAAVGCITMQAVSQLDISATQIRALLQSNKSAQYLAPNSVLQYIKQHRLY